MRKILSLTVFCFLLYSNLFSQISTESDLVYYAERFYESNFGKFSDEIISNVDVIAVEETPIIYIFCFNNNSFVALNADQRYPAILAYSLSSSFSREFTNESEMLWYSFIAEELYNKRSSLKINNYAIHNSWSKLGDGEFVTSQTKSGFLLSTRWGQGCFYNTQCPNDLNGPCTHTVTGCVATAMAQIMKHWNYPQFGVGSHSYDHLLYGTLFADFGATEYLWSQMPDELTEENNAVATLMSHCGVAVEMQYSASSSGGAPTPDAFVDYFGYSLNADYAYKSNYSDQDWKNMLRYQIDNGIPVLYVGHSDIIPEGHAWVLDGYDVDDYFHFNWGWDSDGAFYLLDDNLFPLSHYGIINIFPAHECDIKLGEIIHPISMTYTEPTYISVVVENYGSNPASNIPVSYVVDDDDIVTEIISETINPGESITYQFAQTYDFSQTAGGIYNLKIYSDLDCETYRLNDTVFKNVVNVMCADIPYQISSGDEDMGWLIEDSNDDGVKWILSDEGFAPYYQSSTENGADDWLMSKCISLEQGKLYKMSFDYKGIGIYWFHNLEVFLGSAPFADFMTRELLDLNDLNNGEWQSAEKYFTVDEAASYYFGFHIYSQPEMLSFLIDNFEIVELAEPDVMLSEVISPVSSCMMGEEQVSVEIINLSSQVLSDITMKYQIGEGEIVSDNYGETLSPGESVLFNFSSYADLSEYGEYSIKIWSECSGDTNQENDSLFVNVKNKTNADLPYLIGFEVAAEYDDWTVENINDDNKTWQFASSGGHTQPACAKYEYNDFEAADDWLISKCVWLESGYIYKLSFWYKVEDASWPENLKVMFGNTQTSSAMDILLEDLPGLTNNTYQQVEMFFPIWNDDFYYFGFQCYSIAQMFNLYIDDIEIDVDGVNNLEIESTNDFMIYPNPAKDMVSIIFIGNDASEKQVVVCDINGRIVKQSNQTSKVFEIDFSTLISGVYFVTITTGDKCLTKRIMKL